jgi:hypothetical protein
MPSVVGGSREPAIAMGPLQIVLLVVGILAVQALALLAALRWVRRRTAETLARLGRELDAAGERTMRGPEAAVYRGGTGNFSRVKGNGALALTERRLVFAKLLGAPVELFTADILEAREGTWFRRSAVGGQVHVIVKTRRGDEVGFFVQNREGWLADLRAVANAGAANADAATTDA